MSNNPTDQTSRLTFVLWDGSEEVLLSVESCRILPHPDVVVVVVVSWLGLWTSQQRGHTPPSLHTDSGTGITRVSSSLVLRAGHKLVGFVDHHALTQETHERMTDTEHL